MAYAIPSQFYLLYAQQYICLQPINLIINGGNIMQKITKQKLILGLFTLYFPASAAASVCGIVGGGETPLTIDHDQTKTVSISSYTELQNALIAGEKNIYIPGNVTITIPNNKHALIIPEGVLIFSDRGTDNSPGALLQTDYISEAEHYYPVITIASNVELNGLRIKGPNDQITTDNLTIGIQSEPNSQNIIITNSEIFNWPGAALSLKSTLNAKVSYSYIHHNRKSSRGYGVVVQNGSTSAAIYCNVFDANRHSIAGSGESGESYTASYNLVLPEGKGHAFDMHKTANPNSEIGGSYINISHNWFNFGGTDWGHYPSINVRGIPESGAATIEHNYFTSPVQYLDAGARTKRAIEGVSEAIPTDAVLTNNNQFGIGFNYNNDGQQCSFSYDLQTQQVNCAAIASVLP